MNDLYISHNAHWLGPLGAKSLVQMQDEWKLILCVFCDYGPRYMSSSGENLHLPKNLWWQNFRLLKQKL